VWNRDGDDDWPWLVTLGLDPGMFDRLDALRARYFPPERNVVPAHVSLFHHLPRDREDAVRPTLERVAGGTGALPLTFTGLFRLSGGMAVRVESPGLSAVRRDLAAAFDPWLTAQDRQPFRPHVTLMNKAERSAAARAFDELAPAWSPSEGTGESLLLWSYRGGPWELAGRYPFAPQAAG